MMRKWKAIFTVMTVLFALAGLTKLLSYDISMPVMFVFMGLVILANAKEYYDKGSKKDAMIFGGVAVFLYLVTAYNLIEPFFR